MATGLQFLVALWEAWSSLRIKATRAIQVTDRFHLPQNLAEPHIHKRRQPSGSAWANNAGQ